jgi:hypothetical protein
VDLASQAYGGQAVQADWVGVSVAADLPDPRSVLLAGYPVVSGVVTLVSALRTGLAIHVLYAGGVRDAPARHQASASWSAALC